MLLPSPARGPAIGDATSGLWNMSSCDPGLVVIDTGPDPLGSAWETCPLPAIAADCNDTWLCCFEAIVDIADKAAELGFDGENMGDLAPEG